MTRGGKDELASLLNDCNICLQIAKQDILENGDMIANTNPLQAWLQESQHKLMAENKVFTMLKARLLSQSK